jgi:hypothetical protein
MSPPPTPPRIVALADLAEAYGVPDYLPADWRILVVPGDLIVDGDLLLDWDRPRGTDPASQHHWRDAAQHSDGEAIDGLAIEGSLHVSGALINLSDGPILLVRDHLRARTLIAGGSFIRIRGDVEVTDTVLGHTNHGELHIDGTVTAPLLIWNDHLFNATTLNAPYTFDTRAAVWEDWEYDDDLDGYPLPEQLKPILREEFGCWDEVMDALRAGKEVVKPNLGGQASST